MEEGRGEEEKMEVRVEEDGRDVRGAKGSVVGRFREEDEGVEKEGVEEGVEEEEGVDKGVEEEEEFFRGFLPEFLGKLLVLCFVF